MLELGKALRAAAGQNKGGNQDRSGRPQGQDCRAEILTRGLGLDNGV